MEPIDDIGEIRLMLDDVVLNENAVAASSHQKEKGPNLNKLLSKSCLDTENAREVLAELRKKAEEEHPFETFGNGKTLPEFVLFGHTERENMSWDLVNNQPSYYHSNRKLMELMDQTPNALPVFDIVSLVLPIEVFHPNQKTIGDIQHGSESGFFYATALYFLCEAMSNTGVGTPSMRLVEGIPFPVHTDMVCTFKRKHRKVTLLMMKLVRDNAGVGDAEDLTEAFAPASSIAQFVLNREDNMAGVRFVWLVHDPYFDPDEAIRATMHNNSVRLGIVPKTGNAAVSDEFMKRLFDTENMSGDQRIALEKRIKTATTAVRQEETRMEKRAAKEAETKAVGVDPLANSRNITNMLALNNCVFAPYLEEDNVKQGSQAADLLLSVDVHSSNSAIPSQLAFDLTTYKRAFALVNPVVARRMNIMGVCALQANEERLFMDIAVGDPEMMSAIDRHGIVMFSPLIPECISMADMAQSHPEYIASAPPPWNTISAVEAKLVCYERVVEQKENARLSKKNGKRRARMTKRELQELQEHTTINNYIESNHSGYDRWDEFDENLSEEDRQLLEEFRQGFIRQENEKQRYVDLGASSRLVGHNPYTRQIAETTGAEGEVTLRVVSPLENPREKAILIRTRIANVAAHLDREAYDDLIDSFRIFGKRNLESVLMRNSSHTVGFNKIVERYQETIAKRRSVFYGKVQSQNLELSNSFLAQDYVNLYTLGVTNGITATRSFCMSVYRSSSNRETEKSTNIGNGTPQHTIWLGPPGVGKSFNKEKVKNEIFIENSITDQGTGSRRANTDIRPDGDGANIFDEVPAALMGGSSTTKRADPEFAAQESEWKSLLSEGKMIHSICSLVEVKPGSSHEERALFGRKKIVLERIDKKAISINANVLGDNPAMLDRFSLWYIAPPQSGVATNTDGLVSRQIPSFEQGARGGLAKSKSSQGQLSEELKDRQMLNALFYAALDVGYVEPPNITMWNMWNVIQRNLSKQFPFLTSNRKLGNIPQSMAIQEAIIHGIEMYQTAYISGGCEVNLDTCEVKARPFDLSHLQFISRYAYLTEATAITTMIRHTLNDLIPTFAHAALVLLADKFCGYTMLDEHGDNKNYQTERREKITYLNMHNSDTGTQETDYEIIVGPVRWRDMIRVLCSAGHTEETAVLVINTLSSMIVRRNYASGYNSSPDGTVRAMEYVPSNVKKAGYTNNDDSGHGHIRISITALYKCAPKHLIKMIFKTIKTSDFRTHSHLSTPENPIGRVLLTGVSNEVDQYVLGMTECDIDRTIPGHVLDYRDTETHSRMQQMLISPESGFCVTETAQRLCQRTKDRKYVQLHENGTYQYPELEKHLTPVQLAEFNQMDRETRNSLACNFYVHGLPYELAYAHTPLMMTIRNIRLQEILFKKRINELRSFVYPDNVILASDPTSSNRGTRRGRNEARTASRNHEKRIWDSESASKRIATADRVRYVARTSEEQATVVPLGAAIASSGTSTQISDLTVEINRHAEKIAASVASNRSRTASSLTAAAIGFQ